MEIKTTSRFARHALAVLVSAVSVGSGLQAQQFAVPSEVLERVDPGPPLAGSREGLVLEGLRLFLEEDFGGNGRTCASCHPPTHNFTIDAKFIEGLPETDPLFVADSDPALADLEVSSLLRKHGLILENLDGFDQPGVLRGVPHMLGLSQSVATDQGAANRPPFPLAGMTGWSGDGAPGDGTLRQFAIGAVTQHFPRTLGRRPCSASEFTNDPSECDFRVPTEPELDAMEAFQLFLGRQEEVNTQPDSDQPNEIVFLDPAAEAGKLLFEEAPAFQSDGVSVGSRGCGGCHNNAGANDANGNGRQRATGANIHPNSPACDVSGLVDGDGGFGLDPVETIEAATFCEAGSFGVLFQGDMTFNTPSLIEAADTPPFFHNNIVETIEEAVEFYTTDLFGNSPSGGKRKFILDDSQIDQIAAFLRVLNARDNILNGNRYDQLAQRQRGVRPALALLLIDMALSETEDAIEVLSDGPISLYDGAGVRPLLERAMNAELLAAAGGNPALLNQAIRLKKNALELMVEVR